jgi:hypothetical protein
MEKEKRGVSRRADDVDKRKCAGGCQTGSLPDSPLVWPVGSTGSNVIRLADQLWVTELISPKP